MISVSKAASAAGDDGERRRAARLPTTPAICVVISSKFARCPNTNTARPVTARTGVAARLSFLDKIQARITKNYHNEYRIPVQYGSFNTSKSIFYNDSIHYSTPVQYSSTTKSTFLYFINFHVQQKYDG